MQDGDAFESRAEPAAALPTDPKCQRNFGDEHNCGFAARERVLNGAEIDFRFSAAGYTTQQQDAEFAQFETRANPLQRILLLQIEFVGRRTIASVKRVFRRIDVFFPAFEHASFQKTVDNSSRDLREFE